MSLPVRKSSYQQKHLGTHSTHHYCFERNSMWGISDAYSIRHTRRHCLNTSRLHWIRNSRMLFKGEQGQHVVGVQLYSRISMLKCLQIDFFVLHQNICLFSNPKLCCSLFITSVFNHKSQTVKLSQTVLCLIRPMMKNMTEYTI